MKLNIALLVLPLLVSLGFLWLVKQRKTEHVRQQKRNRFQDIKLRVTEDVFREYRVEVAKVQTLLDATHAETQKLESEAADLQVRENELASQKDTCLVGNQQLIAELDTVEAEVNRLSSQHTNKKSSWETEVATLKEQLQQRSKVCNFIKKDSATARKLCEEDAIKNSKVAEAEAPKQEEPKVEEPKVEEPKQEAPKAEEPKAEEPKAEEPKQEAAKQEEPKAEASNRR